MDRQRQAHFSPDKAVLLGAAGFGLLTACSSASPPPAAPPPTAVEQASSGAPAQLPGPEHADRIRVATPAANARVQSPLRIAGEARGTWFFEASFAVALLDGNGKQLAQVPAQARGEWMTEAFVPFEAELAFPAPTTPTGTLVLSKANPSDLPEHADELRVPVRFE